MANLPAEKLDSKAIFGALTFPLIYWCLQVVVVTAFGYPGVVCMTPFAWLLALTVGQSCINRSTSPTKGMRVHEAAYAGVLLGLGQGVVFTLIMLVGEPVTPDEIPRTIFISVLITVGGMLICALFAAAFANWLENKQIEIAKKNLEQARGENDANDKQT